MSASEFQANASVTNKQYAPAKPVSKQAAEQRAGVSNLALKESVTGMKWNKDNEINNQLTHEDTVLLSNTSWHADKVESPDALKPVTGTTDARTRALLTTYKETLLALKEGAHNLLASLFQELKAGTYMALAVARGATWNDIKSIQDDVKKESRARLDVAVANYCKQVTMLDIVTGNG
jgi:hypothetical protein